MKARGRFRCVVSALGAVCAAAMIGAGCASTPMKGTPFYTGEYENRIGPAEDRVNLWPLLYYRKPALSILWPLIEYTDEHAAVRPLFSVYRTEESNRVYNVLWPLAQFDPGREQGRVFPVFWGDDFRTVFPLYWHWGDMGTRAGGGDALFPLWIVRRGTEGYSVDAPWPVFNARDDEESKGWRVWPLAGHYRGDERGYDFFLWPLGHRWIEGETRASSTFFPLYYYGREGAGRSFYSLPYSSAWSDEGMEWQCVMPLFYRSRPTDGGRSRFFSLPYSRSEAADGSQGWSLLVPFYYKRHALDERLTATLLGGWSRRGGSKNWLLLPLLAWGGSAADGSGQAWALGPLAHAAWSDTSRSHHVFPFYYRSSNPAGSTFVSLPWSAQSDADGSAWQLVPPLFWHRRDAWTNDVLFTPLYARGRTPARDERWQMILPLFYARDRGPSRLVATLLGGYETDDAGRRWLLYPLLSGGRRDAHGGEVWALAPLVHAEWDEDSVRHHVMPLYYWDPDRRLFASPLAARWVDEEGSTLLVPPVLSWYRAGASATNLWLAAGLARWGRDADGRNAHLLPLFYRDASRDSFVSPLWASWRRDDGSRRRVVPPAVSWLTSGDERSDLWLVGPLAHFSWGEQAGADHVFPLYYRDGRRDTTVSPLWASWKSGDGGREWVIPPLLSGGRVQGSSRRTAVLLGLYYRAWDTESRSPTREHLVPLYYREGHQRLYTLLFGWNRDEHEGFVYPLTPLVGVRTGEERGGWLFPLFSRRASADGDRASWWYLWGRYVRDGESRRSGMFPFFCYRRWGDAGPEPDAQATYSRGARFFCLPICWYKREDEAWTPPLGDAGTNAAPVRVVHAVRKNGCFPLWSYASRAQGETSTREGSFLIRLYDYRHEVKPAAAGAADGAMDDYTRRRVLWRVMHYERANDDVSVDVFPAITYDRRGTGFRKVSFLWRFFRYERGEGGRKVDLFFIPILRSKGVSS